jgi:hypothetical protein
VLGSVGPQASFDAECAICACVCSVCSCACCAVLAVGVVSHGAVRGATGGVASTETSGRLSGGGSSRWYFFGRPRFFGTTTGVLASPGVAGVASGVIGVERSGVKAEPPRGVIGGVASSGEQSAAGDGDGVPFRGRPGLPFGLASTKCVGCSWQWLEVRCTTSRSVDWFE